MTKDNRYENYSQLLGKVDETFAGIVSRHKDRFSCAAGCFSCCRDGLTVSTVEASYIRDWLSKNDDVAVRISNLSEMMGRHNFCKFLSKDGLCSIYPVRPIICRSHGAPVSWKESDKAEKGPEEVRDVCPLNFKDIDIKNLEAQDVISLDKLNTLLSLINRHFTQSDDGKRTALADIYGEVADKHSPQGV